MVVGPVLRRFLLTVHVVSSVGWIGAVCVFLALSVIGLTAENPSIVRGVYLVMERAGWLTLVPFAFAALLTGIAISLATSWGLFRHYWVLFKLLITAFATLVLMMYMETFRQMAAAATDPLVDLNDIRNPSPALHSVLAILILIVATVLAIYKPQGVTAYGRRKLREQRGLARS